MAYTVPVHGLKDGNVSDGEETEVELHQVREKLRERNTNIGQGFISTSQHC